MCMLKFSFLRTVLRAIVLYVTQGLYNHILVAASFAVYCVGDYFGCMLPLTRVEHMRALSIVGNYHQCFSGKLTSSSLAQDCTTFWASSRLLHKKSLLNHSTHKKMCRKSMGCRESWTSLIWVSWQTRMSFRLGPINPAFKINDLRGDRDLQRNHIRRYVGLEKRDEMPPTSMVAYRKCRRCRKPSKLRCALYRVNYCSIKCQRMHWNKHIFVSCQGERLQNVGYLKIMLRRWAQAAKDETLRDKVLLDFYADDDLC